jgi:tRNA-dihydrouridine synthase
MVEQSELPYRLLARELGAGLCYSPMVHSRFYAEGSATARARMFETTPEDRPLVVRRFSTWVSDCTHSLHYMKLLHTNLTSDVGHRLVITGQ